MPLPLVGLLSKGVASGIGLASEAIADRKERKASKQAGLSPQPSHDSTGASPNSRSRSVSPYPSRDRAPGDAAGKENDKDLSSSDSDDDTDHEEWALDEAGIELADPPPYSEGELDAPAVPVDSVVHSFMTKHSAALQTGSIQPLPAPVILPQRRPKQKTRGFVRAYAPVLGDCAGIDQATFIDFLDDFDRASKASPIFDVINLACFAVGFVPNPIAMAVTTAVQVANSTAKEVQTRYRTNNYLEQMNEYMFKPRGLYCLVMTYKPDLPGQRVIGMDVTGSALSKSLSPGSNKLSAGMKNLRLSSGTSKGDLSLPESAPLVYPALDRAAISAASTDSAAPEKKQNSLKTSTAFMADYFDRRAQAQYNATHAGTKLASAAPPPDKQFASRFADPNHPVNSGSIVSLLTGGNFNPQAGKRSRKAQRRAARRGQHLTETDIKNAEMGRTPKASKGIIGRVLHKDVLYLMVVNLPSEEEMAAIREELDRAKSRSSGRGRSPSPNPYGGAKMY